MGTTLITGRNVLKEKSLNRAFRLKESELQALQEEARQRNVNVNTIINELVAKHVHLDRLIKRSHPVTLTAFQLRLLAEAIPQDKIIELAKETADDVVLPHHHFALEVTGDRSPRGILQALKILCTYTGMYEYSEEDYDGKKTVILVHDFGKNWSLYLSTLWKILLSRAGAEMKTFVSEKAVVFELLSSDFRVEGLPTNVL
jgi:hypothetical protein